MAKLSGILIAGAAIAAGVAVVVVGLVGFDGNIERIGIFAGLVVSGIGVTGLIWSMLSSRAQSDSSPTSSAQAQEQSQRIVVNVVPPAASPPAAQPAADGQPALDAWLGRPPSIGDAFLGREDEIVDVGKTFEEHSAVVLSGGAGAGKSRLAAQYTYGAGVDGFWTQAGATADATLAALGEALGVAPPGPERSDEQVAREVSAGLAGLSEAALWVVDNLGEITQSNSGPVGPAACACCSRHATLEVNCCRRTSASLGSSH